MVLSLSTFKSNHKDAYLKAIPSWFHSDTGTPRFPLSQTVKPGGGKVWQKKKSTAQSAWWSYMWRSVWQMYKYLLSTDPGWASLAGARDIMKWWSWSWCHKAYIWTYGRTWQSFHYEKWSKPRSLWLNVSIFGINTTKERISLHPYTVCYGFFG